MIGEVSFMILLAIIAGAGLWKMAKKKTKDGCCK
jgi:hypothetical protein